MAVVTHNAYLLLHTLSPLPKKVAASLHGLPPHIGVSVTVLGIGTDPGDPGLHFEKLNQISSLMTLPNTPVVGQPLQAPPQALGLGLMNY